MAQPAGQLEEREIYYFLARHMQHHSAQNLIEIDEPTSFVCGLCIMPGFGSRYDCRHCKVKIHRICGSRLLNNLPCVLHPTTHWMFLDVVEQGAEICSVCQKFILGLHYKSECGNLRVHPICHNLRVATNTDATALIPPPNAWLHTQHALRERYLPKQYECDGCGTNGMGRRFYCGDCGFNLHPDCALCPSVMQPCFLSRDGDVYLRTLPSGLGRVRHIVGHGGCWSRGLRRNVRPDRRPPRSCPDICGSSTRACGGRRRRRR